MTRSFVRQATSLVLIALMTTGCSRAIVIPREQIDDPAYKEPGSYRIRLHGREEYFVRRFAVTDSTVLIQELHASDERYRWEQAGSPVTIPLADVESISRMELNPWLTFGVVVTSGLAIAFFVFIATADISFE